MPLRFLSVLQEIQRHCPVELNHLTSQKVAGVPTEMGFDDQHQFTVNLPAWVFREVKSLLEGALQ